MPGNRTIPRLWRDAVARNTGTGYLVEQDGTWREVPWAEAAERVTDLANGLLARGVGKGEAFGILARNTLEWSLFDFALAHVGAVGAAIYANSAPGDVQYVLAHSESVGVLCEDDTQRAKVEAAGSSLPGLRLVLTFADLPALEEEGREYAEANPGALDAAVAAIDEEDLFTFIYTSGTTGPPKGCMIRHRNYYAMVATADGLPDAGGPGDVMLLYLPLAHNFGRLMHLSGPYLGYAIAFLADPLDVARAMPEVRPTILPSVPRVYEKVHTAVASTFAEATGARRRLIEWAMRVGRRESALRQQGSSVPVDARPPAPPGGQARLLEGEGAPRRAPAPPDLGRRAAGEGDRRVLRRDRDLHLRGIRPHRVHDGRDDEHDRAPQVRHGRAGAARLRAPTRRGRRAADPQRDSVRRLLQGARGDGEVLGDDGWLRSGDIASIDEDGFVTITDRKRDILVTAGGKNIAPQNLENDLKTSRFVSQAIVVGDRKPFPAALITLDPVEIGKWASAQGIDGDATSLADDPRVRDLVAGIVDDVNRERSRFEQIKRFAILPRDFEMDRGEVTPTLKLRRRVVLEHFAAEVAELYDGTAPDGAARAERTGAA